jgi:putative transposase
MSIQNPDYGGYRFPPEIISYAVWLYHRFCLSFRDVEELLAERGVTVSYEAVRQWCRKFGQEFARKLRHRQGRSGDTWHLDEVFVTINGERHYLWRAVDQDGQVLDILVQKHRDQRAAKRFFRKLLKGLRYVPRLIVTDKLGSYGVARWELLPGVAHCQDRRLNNRAEVSHQPTRQRERQMRRFKSPRHAQRFLSVHGPINNLFRCGRHLMRAAYYRGFREQAFMTWREVAGLPLAA